MERLGVNVSPVQRCGRPGSAQGRVAGDQGTVGKTSIGMSDVKVQSASSWSHTRFSFTSFCAVTTFPTDIIVHQYFLPAVHMKRTVKIH